jgi:hypothetical protein
MAITSELRLLRRIKNMRNYVTKLLRETKKNSNYVTLWRIRIQEVKSEGLYCGKYPVIVVSRNYVTFHFRKWLLRVTRNST